jgi:DAK2 domain fusion protein YloV
LPIIDAATVGRDAIFIERERAAPTTYRDCDPKRYGASWFVAARQYASSMPGNLQILDATALRLWCANGLTALRRHQGEIDELNVYPVPDRDTGTNLVLTMTAAQRALAVDDPAAPGSTPHGRVLQIMARGSLLGARGNSGVILSQILRGLADALSAVPAIDGPALGAALRTAAAAGYHAVETPAEGTVLTVAAAAATGAESSGARSLAAVVSAATASAAEALAHTPEQLPELARAGVVDAGGRGLCILLDALLEVIIREPPAAAPTPAIAHRTFFAACETGSLEYDYELQFLVDTDEDGVKSLRRALSDLGDSLVVVGTGGATQTWNVHVHVNDVDAAIQAGMMAGRPYQISITRTSNR